MPEKLANLPCSVQAIHLRELNIQQNQVRQQLSALLNGVQTVHAFADNFQIWIFLQESNLQNASTVQNHQQLKYELVPNYLKPPLDYRSSRTHRRRH